jgi:hypothetical protein
VLGPEGPKEEGGDKDISINMGELSQQADMAHRVSPPLLEVARIIMR